jgi:hypothetical protein
MARSPVVLNAQRSQRLLWRQKLREQQAQAGLASVRAARTQAEARLEAKRVELDQAAQFARDAMRARWDDCAGKLLTADMLNTVRGAELELGDGVRRVEQDVADTIAAIGELANEIEAAAAIVMKECTQTMHRERVATYCKVRLVKLLAQREERALEDDLAGRETYLS